MPDNSYVAFDLGASSGRAMLGTIKNDKLHLEEMHRFPNCMIRVMGHYHWDILNLFQHIKDGLAKTIRAGHDVTSLGIDTWGVDFGFVGRGDVLLANPYAYRDIDSTEFVDKVTKIISRKELYKMTGIQFLPFNSLFQLYRLVTSNNPLVDAAENMLFTPDLLNFLLTGKRVSEYSIASTSQLLDPFQKTWKDELFEKLNLPRELMADIVPSGSEIGPLLHDIQDETDARDVTVIAPACHDTGSAVAAVPARGNDWAYLSSGTWSLIGIESMEPIINEQSMANNFTNEGGVNGTIRFLKNIAGLWLLQCLKSSWQQQGEDLSYDDMTRLASEAQPFKCHVDPDDERFIDPPDMPKAIADFCRETSQPIPETKGEYIRCSLESLALKYRACVESMNEMRDKPIEKLHIVGGGTQNELLNQLAADASGVPVVAGPVEATAIGNIMAQAMSRGEISSLEQGRELVGRSFKLKEYSPKETDCWDEVYAEFVKRVG